VSPHFCRTLPVDLLAFYPEAQAEYMLKMINRWQTENIHSFSPKIEAMEDFISL